MAVDPPEGAVHRFVAQAPEDPVVMLNLLRFRRDGGRERYAEYLRLAGEVTAELGIRVVYVGTGLPPLVAEAGQEWDAVLLVSYPSRRVFGRLVDDPRYRAVAHLRQEALEEAVLQPTTAF